MSLPSKEKMMELLKQVRDPELDRDIVSLGMVKSIEIDSGNVFVQLEVSSAEQTVNEKIKEDIRKTLLGAGVEKVAIQISKPVRHAAPFSSRSQQVPGIDHVIAVASGKGGVGKTTVAVNLACALAQQGFKTGLMDGDIYGPNVPLMLGIPADTKPQATPDGKIIPIEVFGLKTISMGYLVPPDQPMVWRGPMLHSAVTQFIQKVEWGELDYLVVDLPPGTGDVQLSLVQTVPLSGSVIVTTPQEVALMDVRKGIAMFRKTEVPILGIIENMTGTIFGHGGGKKAASQFQVPYLGEIPLDARIRECGDAGKPVVLASPESPAATAIMNAAKVVVQSVSASLS